MTTRATGGGMLTGRSAVVASGVLGLAVWGILASQATSPAMLLVLLAVAWGVIAFVMPPGALLAVYIFAFPLSLAGVLPPLADIGGAAVQVVDVLLLLLAARTIVDRAWGARGLVVPDVLRWLLAYVLVVMVSTLWLALGDATAVGLATRETVALARFLSQVLLYVTVVNAVAVPGGPVLVGKVLFAFGVVFAGSVWLQRVLFAVGLPLWSWVGESVTAPARFGGLLGDTSRSALVVMFFLFLVLCGGHPGRGRAARAAWLVFFAGAIVLTGTRGALLGLIAGWVTLSWTWWRAGGGRRRLLLLNGVLAAAAVTALLVVPALRAGFARAPGRSLLFTLEGRLLPMLDSLRVVADHPWLGVGYAGGQFFQSLTLLSAFAPNYFWPRGSYNVYLEAALNGGVLGLLAFALFALAVLRRARSLARHAVATNGRDAAFARATLIFAVVLFVGTQTENWLSAGEIVAYFFWIVLGTAEAAHLVRDPAHLMRDPAVLDGADS